MQDWERDQIRSANTDLRATLDQVQGEFDREMAELGEVNHKLAAMKVHAMTPSELARVTVNASGMVVDITIAEDAYRRSSPRKLSEELNVTIRGAVEAASEAREQIVAPIKAIADGMPDPGAPDLRDLQAQLSDISQTPPDQSG